MNVFEDLIDELKEENLLESTVIDHWPIGRGRFLPSRCNRSAEYEP